MKHKFLLIASLFIFLLYGAASEAHTVIIHNDSTEHTFTYIKVNACEATNPASCSDFSGGDIYIGAQGAVNTGAKCPKYIILSTKYILTGTSVQRSQCIYPTTNTIYSYPSGCIAVCGNSEWRVKIIGENWNFQRIK